MAYRITFRNPSHEKKYRYEIAPGALDDATPVAPGVFETDTEPPAWRLADITEVD